MSSYYVYIYRNRDGHPVYVGKGRGKRAWAHKKRKVFWALDAEPEIVFKTASEAEAFAFEAVFIAKFGRRNNQTGTLYNLVDGSFDRRTTSAVIDRTQELCRDSRFVENCLARSVAIVPVTPEKSALDVARNDWNRKMVGWSKLPLASMKKIRRQNESAREIERRKLMKSLREKIVQIEGCKVSAAPVKEIKILFDVESEVKKDIKSLFVLESRESFEALMREYDA